MDLLKFMEDPNGKNDLKPTNVELEKWDKLNGKQAYNLVSKNIEKGMNKIFRATGMCFNRMPLKQVNEFVEGFCVDLSNKGFKTEKVIQYIKSEQWK